MSPAPTDGALIAACYRGLDPFLRLCGTSEGGSLHEHEGAISSIAPLIPLASLFNATSFDRDRPQTLRAALDAMWRVYDDSPVMRWSAWIVEGDAAAEEIARARGMTVDSTPRAMGAALTELDLSAPVDNVVERWDMTEAARINELGYGVPVGLFGATAVSPQPERARSFFALEDGRPAAVVISLANGSDCAIFWVASDPVYQGKGLAKSAMTAALLAAREDGFETTTLQSSAAGAPLYRSLGYRDLGVAVNLWQHTRYA